MESSSVTIIDELYDEREELNNTIERSESFHSEYQGSYIDSDLYNKSRIDRSKSFNLEERIDNLEDRMSEGRIDNLEDRMSEGRIDNLEDRMSGGRIDRSKSFYLEDRMSGGRIDNLEDRIVEKSDLEEKISERSERSEKLDLEERVSKRDSELYNLCKIVSLSVSEMEVYVDKLNRGCLIRKPEGKFTYKGVCVLKKLAEELKMHYIFVDLVNNMEQFLIPELEGIFEQKLAMYIMTNIINRNSGGGTYIINEEIVVDEINEMVIEIIQQVCESFNKDNSINLMVDTYPLRILCTVCDADYSHAKIIVESVRQFIEVRTKTSLVPMQLSNLISGYHPLVGSSSSPLTDEELEVLYRYLGSRKNIYIHIVLNALFEFSQNYKFFDKMFLTEEELLTVIKSSWLYLILLTNNETVV